VTSSEVIWTDLGGAIRKARQAAYFDPFTREYGIPVTFAEGFSQAKFLAGTKAGNPPTDSFDATARFVISLTEQGLAPKLPGGVNRTSAVAPAKYRDYRGGGYAYSLGTTYQHSASRAAPPKRWKDFFDLKKYPGKRALPKYSGSEQYAVEVALLADGVAKDKLFPLDIDRALNKLRSIKDSILFFDSASSSFMTTP